MSLFDEMRAARSRGELAVTPPEKPPGETREERPAEVVTRFLDIPSRPGVLYCCRCGALAVPETTPIHVAWHQTVGT